MDIYGINNITGVSKSLEVLEKQLEGLKAFQKMDLAKYFEITENHFDLLVSTYQLSDLISFEDKIEDLLESVRKHGVKFQKPFLLTIIRRINRRIERLRKKISKRFIDFRIEIRTFAKKVTRRNTEEELINVVLEILREKKLLQTHINYVWKKNLFWSY
ncbi:hypothetical protein [Sphingobacterium paludis]|uniref:Uncharacterized protein n=1 Tax=Sphingobacterium paludis TaxID=1476465 RepID=A0A4V3E1U6_9SPHI|nr:hypothetical protein [Sphingobacterium paludis]TDS14718.1 hypothetical protein B0I21_103217 [Sphingobacterium paludis]